MRSFVQVAFALISLIHVGVSADNIDYHSFSFNASASAQTVTVHVATISDVSGGKLSVKPPLEGCGHRVKTSATATADGCTFATNAGFFNMDTGACIGAIVSDGKVVEVDNSSKPVFAITSSGKMVFDDLTSGELASMGAVQAVAGSDMLVTNGKKSCTAASLVAPRTGVAVNGKGQAMLVVVDGIETLKAGVYLTDFADIMLHIGAVNALNLDGGGSSTAFYNGKIVNQPTCEDIPIICERTVTTIMCAV
uniref:Phosphodiester glycosidase domain-containing protein n=1 Tax=Palpitomonas bilix TaxID=652834 RepID=A0A7S3GAC3_9EUKA|mmetsp:Transcript_32653/g.84306  ORF Transcript_32653/g.84306 Transcript_32653/m.84306 type:complete len:251 (+) Transcript_32653:59-811(+)